ncbi:hypothetical protein T459_11015 [Capsicum annuum]|uniref:RBR-type E3 ubiquitin transferase n=1 Tax=Capsicum annuum TaxID=4072 RepID=A0A1U8GEY6_CAPAN|nr:hypothetical protein T459_11015 [Capsicum annuum]
MNSRDVQIFNHDEETDSQLSFDINENEDDVKDDDDDIQLQQILFHTAQFHSVRSLESSSSNVAGKKIIELHYSFIYGSIEKLNSIREEGESSCMYCDICEDVFPSNTMIRGIDYPHLYYEECIQKHIAKKINDNIYEVKCPIANCKGAMDLEFLLPYVVFDRVVNANREAKVLTSPYIMDYPYEYCSGILIDDGKGYLIRACPNCWRIFCARCRDTWHWGITCEAYDHISSQMNFIVRRFEGFVVQHPQQEE